MNKLEGKKPRSERITPKPEKIKDGTENSVKETKNNEPKKEKTGKSKKVKEEKEE